MQSLIEEIMNGNLFVEDSRFINQLNEISMGLYSFACSVGGKQEPSRKKRVKLYPFFFYIFKTSSHPQNKKIRKKPYKPLKNSPADIAKEPKLLNGEEDLTDIIRKREKNNNKFF